jgi:hypothetical protein
MKTRLLLLVEEAVGDVERPRLDHGQLEGLSRTLQVLGGTDVNVELLELPLGRAGCKL